MALPSNKGKSRGGRPLDGRPWQQSNNFTLSRGAQLDRIMAAPPELEPYLIAARRWRDETLTAVGIQYNSLGPIPCQLIHIACLSWAMAHRAIGRDKASEAKLHLAEVRSCLLACWSIASREGGTRGHDPTEPLREALASWEDTTAFPTMADWPARVDEASTQGDSCQGDSCTPVPVLGVGGVLGPGPQSEKRRPGRQPGSKHSPETIEKIRQSLAKRRAEKQLSK